MRIQILKRTVKKIKFGLFAKVLIAIVLGSLLGMVAPDVMVRILKTFNVLFAQLLKFIVPLLVIGMVTPSIANLGRGAGKMLVTVICLSYLFTIGAGFFAFGCSSSLLPHYIGYNELTSAVDEKTFEPIFRLEIPPICDIMTALTLSFIVGIGIVFTKADAIRRGFAELESIVKLTIEKAIIPFLPLYIFTMMCEMSASGKMSTVLGSGVKVILTGVCISICYLIIQYIIAGAIAGKNPFKCLWNIIPAYLTGFSLCSSSAVIPVTLECVRKNGASKEITEFTVPLCATVHMCGSTIKLITTTIAVMIMSGMEINFSLVANLILLQGIAAVAAPGVMGGVLMASIGLVESILGFTPEQSALMMAIYLALDGYGPACNVSGDGAITLIVDRFFGKKEVGYEY